MDRCGKGKEILFEKVFTSELSGLSFRNFDKKLFTGMCVLAGCDFLPSIPGIGIRRAYSFVSKYRNLDRVLSVLKFEKSGQMPADYPKSFKEAITVFHHARIYDPDTKSLKPMKPLPDELLKFFQNDLDFLGPEVPPSIAIAIAEGRINPITMEAFDHFPLNKCHIEPATKDLSNNASQPEVQMIVKEKGCCTIFSAPKIEYNTVMEQSIAFCSRYSREADALQNLIANPEPHKRVETSEVDTREIPKNNPFKKLKTNAWQLKSTASKHTAVVVNISEYSGEGDVLQNHIARTELPQRVEASEIDARKIPKNNLFKKQKANDGELKLTASKHASAVTDIRESAEMGCRTSESEKSFKSKLAKRCKT